MEYTKALAIIDELKIRFNMPFLLETLKYIDEHQNELNQNERIAFNTVMAGFRKLIVG